MGPAATRTAIRTALVAAALAGAACEETLEACAPCALPADGAAAASGDPRLDGVLEAVVRVAQDGERAVRDYDAAVDALAHAAGHPHEEGPDGVLVATAADVAQIADLLRAALFEQAGVTAAIEVGAPECAVDARLALARQIACESAVGCYVDAACDAALGSCAGLCVGSCTSGGGGPLCAGDCWVDAAGAGDSCLGDCIGTCALATPGPCAGRCRGSCSAACTAYSAAGDCDGLCAGDCGGECTTSLPAGCAGACTGSCDVAFAADPGCAGVCRGDCAEGLCAGGCRGQFRPEGCDLPSRCAGVLACQETAKDLAWAHLACSPARVRVAVATDGSFAGDRAALFALASALEEALAALLHHWGRLALLVDGVDPAGEIAAADIVEEADPEARPYAVTDPGALVAAGVPADRAGLPLSVLRARASALATDATSGRFDVAAGAVACVRPAFEDALAMLDALIPIEDRDTSAADPTAWPEPVADRTRGLYRVLDGATALLGLAPESKR